MEAGLGLLFTCGYEYQWNRLLNWNYNISISCNILVYMQGVNKGLVAKRLLSVRMEMSPDFVPCIGDDRSDEDMFEGLACVTEQTVPLASLALDPPVAQSVMPVNIPKRTFPGLMGDTIFYWLGSRCAFLDNSAEFVHYVVLYGAVLYICSMVE
ncbi:unnamed protein product [Malus baccata var. baccata]